MRPEGFWTRPLQPAGARGAERPPQHPPHRCSSPRERPGEGGRPERGCTKPEHFTCWKKGARLSPAFFPGSEYRLCSACTGGIFSLLHCLLLKNRNILKILRLTDTRRAISPLPARVAAAPSSRCPARPQRPEAAWAQLQGSRQKLFLQHSAKIFLSTLILQHLIYDSQSDQLSYNLSRKASVGVNQCLLPIPEMAKAFVKGSWSRCPRRAAAAASAAEGGRRGPAELQSPTALGKYSFFQRKKVNKFQMQKRRRNQRREASGAMPNTVPRKAVWERGRHSSAVTRRCPERPAGPGASRGARERWSAHWHEWLFQTEKFGTGRRRRASRSGSLPRFGPLENAETSLAFEAPPGTANCEFAFTGAMLRTKSRTWKRGNPLAFLSQIPGNCCQNSVYSKKSQLKGTKKHVGGKGRVLLFPVNCLEITFGGWNAAPVRLMPYSFQKRTGSRAPSDPGSPAPEPPAIPVHRLPSPR
ncbi:uncharacterized protein LOC134147973 [Rhea pennata]|uniref:uncharacterized protein LOC134147973 n=1 Tax=Rhea pennata TaxID=8795 RepID=UPI002E2614AD